MACGGVAAHKWELEVVEGAVVLSTRFCGSECSFPYGSLGDSIEQLHMEPIPVTVEYATSCPAYPTDIDQIPTGPAIARPGYESGGHWINHGVRCDCDWWPVVKVKNNKS
jgi:hypothetical protein